MRVYRCRVGSLWCNLRTYTGWTMRTRQSTLYNLWSWCCVFSMRSGIFIQPCVMGRSQVYMCSFWSHLTRLPHTYSRSTKLAAAKRHMLFSLHSEQKNVRDLLLLGHTNCVLDACWYVMHCGVAYDSTILARLCHPSLHLQVCHLSPSDPVLFIPLKQHFLFFDESMLFRCNGHIEKIDRLQAINQSMTESHHPYAHMLCTRSLFFIVLGSLLYVSWSLGLDTLT